MPVGVGLDPFVLALVAVVRVVRSSVDVVVLRKVLRGIIVVHLGTTLVIVDLWVARGVSQGSSELVVSDFDVACWKEK